MYLPSGEYGRKKGCVSMKDLNCRPQPEHQPRPRRDVDDLIFRDQTALVASDR